MAVKEAILLIGHGSQDPEGSGEYRAMVQEVSRKLGASVPRIEHAFLEFAPPTIFDAIGRLVEEGVNRIFAVPVMLLDAGHRMLDIPHELSHAMAHYPGLDIRYGDHLGFHQNMMQVVIRRLRNVPKHLTEETGVLLVGRGSSDPVANSNFYKFSRMVWESLSYPWVENGFIGITRPSLPEGLTRTINLGAKTIVVAPYFLFTGKLYKRIVETVKDFRRQYPERTFYVTQYFGLERDVIDVVAERITDVLQGRSTAYHDDWMRGLAEHRYGARAEHSHHHGDVHPGSTS